MPDLKKKTHRFNKTHLRTVGILTVLVLAVFMVWFVEFNGHDAADALVGQIKFVGEYRIGDGRWQQITEGRHIPATKGDVTLKGQFHIFSPYGDYIGVLDENVPIAFYTDHINLTFYENGEEPYVIDTENSLFKDAVCEAGWTIYHFRGSVEDEIEIVVHNPHRFGNETAIDELLSRVAIGGDINFEKNVLLSEWFQLNAGIICMIAAVVMLGIALFSAMLHIRSSRIIALLGMAILSASVYLLYSTHGIAFLIESASSRTAILGISMMMCLLFVCEITASYILKETEGIGRAAVNALMTAEAVFLLLPVLSDVYFYDTWLFWVIVQTLVNIVLIGCLIKEGISADKKGRCINAVATLYLLIFEIDAAATAIGWWSGGMVSKYVFAILLIAALIFVLRIIPEGIHNILRTRELELQKNLLEAEKNAIKAELKENRIAIMLSQIQPHFIYNTLGTIERMCLTDPQKAFELVRNFSLYLRGNFSELDSVIPITVAEELKHVRYYVNIEKVRFPDINIEYDVQATDFVLPALSVQPLVENAVKHGLMRLDEGGTVVIRSYETPTHFCVEVEDNGAGFDTGIELDDKKHIGLRNIRGRLQAMVNGELIVESKPGAGTKAAIMIPKEVTQ